MNDMLSTDAQPLLGKQPRKDLLDVLATLELCMSIEGHGLNQGLGLLPTRFPDGFDGQARSYQWWGETRQVQERVGDEHQTPVFLYGFGAPHPILVQSEVALAILIKGFQWPAQHISCDDLLGRPVQAVTHPHHISTPQGGAGEAKHP